MNNEETCACCGCTVKCCSNCGQTYCSGGGHICPENPEAQQTLRDLRSLYWGRRPGLESIVPN